MCRHLAFAGGPVQLSFPVLDCERALVRQARDPKTCGDGYGLAWYTDAGVERRASSRPIWEDEAALAFTKGIRSRLGMAAARNASEPGVRVAADCAPFVSGSYAFSLDGYLEGFPDWQPAVAQRVTPARRRAIGGSTDGEHLLQWILTRVERGEGVPEAMANVVGEVAAIAGELGRRAQLNLLLATGNAIFATRAGTTGRSNSLYTCSTPSTNWVASEPLFPGAWTPVPEGALVTLDGSGATTRPLQAQAHNGGRSRMRGPGARPA